MISVIVPVYNVEKYLRRCVETIQKQTYADLEIILIDDGSTDDSGKICDDFSKGDRRIKVIHKKNEGLSAARNTGMENATGEYITFVDSDDYIDSKMYEKMIMALESSHCDLCMCGSKTVDEQGNILRSEIFENKVYRGAEIIESIVIPLKTAAWNKLIKYESVINSRFPEGKIHGEDLVFFSNYFSEGIKLVTIDYLGYSYVKHSNSITTRGFSEKSLDEVYCKDLASMIISKKYPQYKQVTACWSFRARINVIRKIILQNDILYENIIREYIEWMKENYSLVKDDLDKKTKTEYILLIYFKVIYKNILKLCGR